MQRIAFIMRIKPGTQEEYRRRHQQVWPELLADLKRAGCQNYSIYLRDTELFAYMGGILKNHESRLLNAGGTADLLDHQRSAPGCTPVGRADQLDGGPGVGATCR